MNNILNTLKSKKSKYHPKHNEDGFTLIELIIVVVIIGILAAISVIIFSNQQKASMEASVKSDVVNSRSVMPDTATGKMKDTNLFATQATLTEGNNGSYFVNATLTDACYEVTHYFSETEKTTYHYSPSVGAIKPEGCSDWVSENPNHTSIAFANTNGMVTPAPGEGTVVSPTTPGEGTIVPPTTPGGTPEGGTVIVPGDGEQVSPEKTATCGNATYAVTGDATITCVQTEDNNWNMKTYEITVTGKTSTPTKWSVVADWSAVDNYVGARYWSTGSLADAGAANGNSHTFKGIDRSWNADPTSDINSEYVSSTKNVKFTVQVEVRR